MSNLNVIWLRGKLAISAKLCRPPHQARTARWGLGVALNKYFSKLGNYFHSHLTFYLFIEKPTANAHIQKQFSAPIGINIPCQIVGVVMDLREEAQ